MLLVRLARLAVLPTLLACAGVSAREAAQFPHVLLMGAENYPDEKMSGPARDVCALYHMYWKILSVPRENIIVLMDTDFPIDSPCRAVAVQPLERKTLKSVLRREASWAGMTIVHYSGHGEERNGQQLLRLSTTEKKNTAATEVVYLQEIHSDLTAEVQRNKSIIYFIDACRDIVDAGPGRSNFQRVSAKELVSGAGRNVSGAVFSAARSGEKSAIRTHWKNHVPVNPISYFTWTVIKGLAGGAGNVNGGVSLMALSTYLKDEVRELLSHELGAVRHVQHPDVFLFTPDSGAIQMPAAPRHASLNFLIVIETYSVPLDREGKEMSDPSSHDLIVAKDGFDNTEFVAFSSAKVSFPGPFVIDIRDDEPLDQVAKWNYHVRLTYLFGSDRFEYIFCADAPTVPSDKLQEAEVSSRIKDGKLIVDALKSLAMWGRAMDVEMDRHDAAAAPRYVRLVNQACR